MCIKLQKISRWLLMASALVAAQELWAWSAAGHKALTRAAMSSLTAEELNFYRNMARQLNWVAQGERKSDGDANNRFVALSVLADEFRDLTLGDLFARFDEKIPVSLQRYSDKNTSTWHYHNEVADQALAKRCKFANRGKLIEASLSLDKTLRAQLSPKQEAIAVALQMHLIEDLHQPLHTFTRLDKNCRSDRGGNGSCYKRGASPKSCERNLHAQWDQGFGVFDAALPKLGPYSASQLAFDPAAWVAASLHHYGDVYGLGRSGYDRRAAKIVAENADLGRARLSAYLSFYYQQKKTHESYK